MKIKHIIGIALSLLIIESVFSQGAEQLPWQQRDRANMKPLDYDYQREADVFWSKNIWRIIDVRQKMNLPFAYPPQPLIKLIHEAAVKGEIKVYDPTAINADQFKKEMSVAEIRNIGVKNYTSMQANVMNPDVEEIVTINNPLTWDKITKFKLKEVWFFDTKTSSMQVRILGIAPIMEDYDEQGHYRGDMTMYWVYYPDLRDMLAKQEVFNPQNDWQHYSWDDLFTMRYFESYIYKESNVYDRDIKEYASGIDAQLESDRIKQHLFEKEHDMWEY